MPMRPAHINYPSTVPEEAQWAEYHLCRALWEEDEVYAREVLPKAHAALAHEHSGRCLREAIFKRFEGLVPELIAHSRLDNDFLPLATLMGSPDWLAPIHARILNTERRNTQVFDAFIECRCHKDDVAFFQLLGLADLTQTQRVQRVLGMALWEQRESWIRALMPHVDILAMEAHVLTVGHGAHGKRYVPTAEEIQTEGWTCLDRLGTHASPDLQRAWLERHGAAALPETDHRLQALDRLNALQNRPASSRSTRVRA